MSTFFLYLLRWQVSGLVMLPVLAVTKKLPLAIGIALAQLVGALLFFWIDKIIFGG